MLCSMFGRIRTDTGRSWRSRKLGGKVLARLCAIVGLLLNHILGNKGGTIVLCFSSSPTCVRELSEGPQAPAPCAGAATLAPWSKPFGRPRTGRLPWLASTPATLALHPLLRAGPHSVPRPVLLLVPAVIPAVASLRCCPSSCCWQLFLQRRHSIVWEHAWVQVVPAARETTDAGLSPHCARVGGDAPCCGAMLFPLRRDSTPLSNFHGTTGRDDVALGHGQPCPAHRSACACWQGRVVCRLMRAHAGRARPSVARSLRGLQPGTA